MRQKNILKCLFIFPSCDLAGYTLHTFFLSGGFLLFHFVSDQWLSEIVVLYHVCNFICSLRWLFCFYLVMDFYTLFVTQRFFLLFVFLIFMWWNLSVFCRFLVSCHHRKGFPCSHKRDIFPGTLVVSSSFPLFFLFSFTSLIYQALIVM